MRFLILPVSSSFYFLKILLFLVLFSFSLDAHAQGLPNQEYPAGKFLSFVDRGFRITFWHKGYWYIPGSPETVLDISNPTKPKIAFSRDFGEANGHVGAMIGDYVTHSLNPARLQGTDSGWIDLSQLPTVKTVSPNESVMPGVPNANRGDEFALPAFYPYQDELWNSKSGYHYHDEAKIGWGPEVVIGNLLIAISGDAKNGGIATWDIGNPDNPKLLDVFRGEYSQYSGGRQIYKHHVLLMSSDNRHKGKRTDLIGIDFSDPKNLKLSYTIDKYPFSRYLQVQDEFIFGANANHGFKYDMEKNKEVVGFDPPTINGSRIGFNDFWWLPVGNLVLLSGDGPESMIFSHQDKLDTRAPFVVNHIPAKNAVNQHVKSRIGIVIHETLDKNTINSNNIIVRPVDGGEPVKGLLSWSTYDVITFSPFKPLKDNTTYEVVVVQGGIKDAAGNGVDGYSYKFSTGNKIIGGTTPTPLPTPTRIPTIKPTVRPTIIPTLIPTPGFTSTPKPSSTATPVPQVTSTPRPQPSATPSNPKDINISEISTSIVSPFMVKQIVGFTAKATGGSGELEYSWQFGDGKSLSGKSLSSVNHTFENEGSYTVVLKVTDKLGNTNFSNVDILVIKDKKVSVNSQTIAISKDSKNLYVANVDNDSISFIDLVNNKLNSEVSTGIHPNTVATLDNGDIAVVTEGDDSLWVYSAKSRKAIKQIQLEWGCLPYGLVVNSNIAIVTCSGSGKLTFVNLETQKVIKEVILAQSIKGIALSADKDFALVTRLISPKSGGQVFKVDLNSFKVLETIAFKVDTKSIDADESARGIPNYFSSVAIDAVHNTGWVGGKKDNILAGLARDGSELNPNTTIRSFISKFSPDESTDKYEDRLDIDDHGLVSSLATTSDGAFLFSTFQTNNKLFVFKTNNSAVLNSIDTGKGPYGIVVDEEARKLFVHNMLDRTVQVFNVANLLSKGSPELPLVSTIKTVSFEKLSPEELLGKQVFYDASDTRMSLDGYISCATCHIDGTHDGRVWDFTQRGEGLRNTTSLKGASGDTVGRIHWTGNFDEIQDFEHDIRDEFGGTGFIGSEDISSPLAEKKLGKSKDLDALAAYVNSLTTVSRSPAKTIEGFFTQDALRGAAIFSALDCNSCHTGELYSDSFKGLVHDVGTTVDSSGFASGELIKGFDTPSLLGIIHTPPYFHDGSALTLEEVITGGAVGSTHNITQQLNPTAIAMLLDFLEQLDEKNSKVGGGFSEALVDLVQRATPFDSDGDSINDLDELKYFKTLSKDGTGDSDNDGVSDKDEIKNGSNPVDSSSRPKVIVPTPTESIPKNKIVAPFYLNSGSTSDSSDSDGRFWSVDSFFKGGKSIQLEASKLQPPFNTVREGVQGYDIPVSNGVYLVEIYFSESLDNKISKVDKLKVMIEGNDEYLFPYSSFTKNPMYIVADVQDEVLSISFEANYDALVSALSLRETSEWLQEKSFKKSSSKLFRFGRKLKKQVTKPLTNRRLKKIYKSLAHVEFIKEAVSKYIETSSIKNTKRIRRKLRRYQKLVKKVVKKLTKFGIR